MSLEPHSSRGLFDAMTQGVVCADRAGRVCYANTVAQAVFGFTPEAITAGDVVMSSRRVAGEDGADLGEVETPCRRALSTGRVVTDVVGVFNSRTGENHWLKVTAIPVFEGGEPAPAGVQVIFEDWTDRKQAENERQLLVDVLSLVSSPRDEQELILEIVERLAGWSGCESTEVWLLQQEAGGGTGWIRLGVERSGPMVCSGPRPDCVCGRVLACLPPGTRGAITSAGSYWFNAAGSAESTAEDCELAFRGSAAVIPLRLRGVTYGLLNLGDSRTNRLDARRVALFERAAAKVALGLSLRRADQAVRESEARWHSALEAAGDGVWDWNAERGTVVSRRWQQMMGLPDTSADRILQEWEDRIHPDDRDRVMARVGEHMSGETPNYRCEYRVALDDGTYRWIQSRGKVVQRTADGKPVRFVGVQSDITAQRQAQEALRLLDERYRAVLDEQTDLICRIDPDKRLTFVNDAFCRYFERSRESLLGARWPVCTGVRGTFESQAATLTPSAPEVVFELKIRRSGGDPRWVQFANRALFDQDGNFAEMQCVGRDITELKVAQEALAEKSRELDEYFEHSPDLLFIADPDGKIRRANPEWEQVLGVDVGVLTQGTLFDLVHPADVDATRSALADLREPPRASGFVNRCRTRNGEYRWIEWRAYATEGSIHGAGRDITEQRKIEEALRESEYWLRESQRASKIGSYVMDIPSGRWVNSTGLDEIFGIGPDFPRSVEGWGRLIHPDYRSEMIDYFLNDVARKGEPFNREYMIRRNDNGRDVWVLGRGMVFRDAEGRPVKMAGTIQDITERVAMQEQLLQAQKMESIGRLAGGVAHDFNNLLTVINGYSDLLLRRLPSNDPLRRSISEIRRAGERAVSLTSQLLAFSRRQILQPEVLDLNAVISETERMLRRLLNEDIQMYTVLDPALGLVRADPGQINQVLLNLTVNARDAMPDGGMLSIETANVDVGTTEAAQLNLAPGRYVRMVVSDTGVGIDEQHKHRLFEPFFTTKPTGSGTGLGLATVYGIIQQSGGTISVESEIGQGATFRIYLPRVDDSALARHRSAEPAAALRGTETVLIVEDQGEVRELASAMLGELGYRVLEAPGGAAALELSDRLEDPLDVLLTDAIMPGMSGWALAKELKVRRPDLKVVYMSGYTENAIVRRAVVEHSAGFVQKPFTATALARAIRETVDGGVSK